MTNTRLKLVPLPSPEARDADVATGQAPGATLLGRVLAEEPR